MEYNRLYSKNFGVYLIILAAMMIFGFSGYIADVELWGDNSALYRTFAFIWAFSFVFTGAIGLAFYRGVFLMSDAVIKPRKVEATAEASEAA